MNELPRRIVKPRTRTPRRHPVVAIVGDDWLDENGETGNARVLASKMILPTIAPTLFVTTNAADWVAELDKTFTGSPGWQWRASSHHRDIISPNGKKVAARVSTVIHYFGWKGGNYHKVIDPVTMYGRGLDEIWPGDGPRIIRLLEWGIKLRNFCDENNLDVRPTIGAISSQLLTDPHFYPSPRRKVPAKINERIREQLPGNHYHLHVEPTPDDEWTAHYLDQRRAHHYHAQTVAFPDANTLYAYGRFVNLDQITFKGTWPNFHGLYCLDLILPRKQPTFDLLPPRKYGQFEAEKVFVFSNELPYLLDNGYRVKGVRAAWGSRKADAGIGKYAEWAETQLDKHDDAPWIKPLLLATYGVLASKPKIIESIYKEAKNGIPTTLPTGRNQLTGVAVRGTRKLEPGIANVLHRGMIEAATRIESISLAQWLTNLGHNVLSIYADAVIVEDDGASPLPNFIPEPWRTKGTLNHLQFINQQAFISGEMTKLPGTSQGSRKRQLRVRAPQLIDVAAEMENDEYRPIQPIGVN